MDYQKSAEAIVGYLPVTEGLNMWNRLGTRILDDDRSSRNAGAAGTHSQAMWAEPTERGR